MNIKGEAANIAELRTGGSAPSAAPEAGSPVATTSAETLAYTTVESPLGPILLAGGPTGLRIVNFLSGEDPLAPRAGWREEPELFAEAVRQIRAYFDGELRTFTLSLQPEGTPFQLSVWKALRSIPFGRTISYGELARRIGTPSAVRAVGAANGRNPLPIVIPCHRVIGADGSLTGYHGGVAIKRRLLALEAGEWFV